MSGKHVLMAETREKYRERTQKWRDDELEKDAGAYDQHHVHCMHEYRATTEPILRTEEEQLAQHERWWINSTNYRARQKGMLHTARHQHYPTLGMWSQVLGITEDAILTEKLTRIPKKGLSNGILIEVYSYWLRKRMPDAVLERWLSQLLPFSVNENLLCHIKGLHKEWNQLPPSGQAELESKLFMSKGFIKISRLRKKVQDKKEICNKDLGVYAKKLKISTEQILKGDLPTLKDFEIVNGIVLELYHFWKKKMLSPAFFVEWIRCIHPKKKRINKSIIKKVKALKRRRDELKKANQIEKMRILEKALFRIKSSSEADKSDEMNTLTLRCEHEGCTKKITFLPNQKIKQGVLCQLHKPSRNKDQVSTGSVAKAHVGGLTATILKEMVTKSKTSSSSSTSIPHSPQEISFCKHWCVVCNKSLESISGHRLLSTIEKGKPGIPSGTTLLKRLEKVLGKSLGEHTHEWLCNTCYSTLLRIEKSYSSIFLLQRKFRTTEEAKHSLRPLSLYRESARDIPTICSSSDGVTDIPRSYAENASGDAELQCQSSEMIAIKFERVEMREETDSMEINLENNAGNAPFQMGMAESSGELRGNLHRYNQTKDESSRNAENLKTVTDRIFSELADHFIQEQPLTIVPESTDEAFSSPHMDCQPSLGITTPPSFIGPDSLQHSFVPYITQEAGYFQSHGSNPQPVKNNFHPLVH